MRYDLIRISLISLYAAALLGHPLPGPYLLTQRPCLDLRCQAPAYVLTYVAAMHGNGDASGCFGSIPICFLFLWSKFLASDFSLAELSKYIH